MSDNIITARDFKNAGFCARGIRNYMNVAEMDFKDFVANGATEEEVRSRVGDGVVDRILSSRDLIRKMKEGS